MKSYYFESSMLLWLIPIIVGILLILLVLPSAAGTGLIVLYSTNIGFILTGIIGFISHLIYRVKKYKNAVYYDNQILIVTDGLPIEHHRSVLCWGQRLKNPVDEIEHILQKEDPWIHMFSRNFITVKVKGIDKVLYGEKQVPVRGKQKQNKCEIEYGDSHKLDSLLKHEVGHYILERSDFTGSEHELMARVGF